MQSTSKLATQTLHEAGQSLWVDNISRGMLTSGTLARYIDEFSVTGLTSNPSIFDNALKSGTDYDEGVRALLAQGKSGENLFFDLAIEDLQQAADLFATVHRRTDGVDGWCSIEVSPHDAYNTQATIDQAVDLHARGSRPNLFVKIPGTPEGLPAIEECIYRGIPINVTLLFSVDQYLAAADAYLRGLERRVAEGLNPAVGSVASVFMSRWDTAVADQVPAELADKLALAIGLQLYKAYRELCASDRMLRLANEGARVQRLLWASTSTKSASALDTLYVTGLAAPFTVNTMPDKTLEAFADHGEVGEPLVADGGDSADTLKAFADVSIDIDALGAKLQRDGAAAFVKSWDDLLKRVAEKSGTVSAA